MVTLTAETAIRSPSPKSFSDLMRGSTVIRKIGLSTIVAMPRTFMVPCVLSHSVSSTVMPPMAMSTLPEISASLAAGPELNLLVVTLGAGMPRRVACFSISFSS
jgi:hypothetical protein